MPPRSQYYINPSSHFDANSFAAAPSAAGSYGIDYNAAARYATQRNQQYAAIPGANIVNGVAQNAPAQTGGSPLQNYFNALEQSQAESRAANQKRYSSAMGLVGLDPETYQPVDNAQAQAEAHARSTFATGKAPNYYDNIPDVPTWDSARASPGARRVANSAIARGVWNGSAAQNQESKAQTADQFDADMRTFSGRMSGYTTAQGTRERALAQDNLLRRERLGLLESPTDTTNYADLSRIAMETGRGTTDGLSAGAFGGGYGGGGMPSYGGAASNGYFVPQVGGGQRGMVGGAGGGPVQDQQHGTQLTPQQQAAVGSSPYGQRILPPSGYQTARYVAPKLTPDQRLRAQETARYTAAGSRASLFRNYGAQ
jgi:hypothetical protein